MDKNQVWENVKKYAKIFWDGVKIFFAFLFHYIGIFCKFVWKHAKILFKKLRKITKKYIRMLIKHTKAGDYSILTYTIIGLIVIILLIFLLVHNISGGKKKDKKTTTEITTEVHTTEEVDQQAVLREQANYIYQNNKDFIALINDTNPVAADYTFEQHMLNSGYIVDERIYSDLLAMLEACNAAGFEYTIKGGYISADTPGSGEYATGLAFDVTAHNVETLEATAVSALGTNQWLMQNCTQYGFIVRYPEGKEAVTGHAYEPWHFRYVGRDAANFMYTNNLTLEEFYTLLNGGSIQNNGIDMNSTVVLPGDDATNQVSPDGNVTDPNADTQTNVADPNANTQTNEPGVVEDQTPVPPGSTESN